MSINVALLLSKVDYSSEMVKLIPMSDVGYEVNQVLLYGQNLLDLATGHLNLRPHARG